MFYTIVGTQWGDEGKGKIVDLLSEKSEIIVMDVLKEDDGVDINRKLEPEKKKKKPSIIIGDALAKRKKALEAKKLSLKEREAILRGLKEDGGLKLDEENQLNSFLQNKEKLSDLSTQKDEEKLLNLGKLEENANKNVMSAFADLRKREAQDEINELNKITGGGAVFITGRIPEGTSVNVRRARYIDRSNMADKAFSFSENGIQTNSCIELLKDYQKYLILYLVFLLVL